MKDGTMDLSEREKEVILCWARVHPDIREVWLYGSRARGECHSGSDIDLAIVTEGVTLGERQARWTLATWRDELRLSHSVHLEWYDPEADGERVRPGVEQDGILLFRRDTSPK